MSANVYNIFVRQQPIAARACGSADRPDRRPIDPIVIVQLRSGNTTRLFADGDTSTFFCVATLAEEPYNMTASAAAAKEQNQDPSAPVASTLITGTILSPIFYLKDPADACHTGAFFVFSDLNIRSEGNYRIRFDVFGMHEQSVSPVANCTSATFTVYSAKRFPGMTNSTQLSKTFSEQGLKIRIRKDIRVRKKLRTSQDRDGQTYVSPSDSTPPPFSAISGTTSEPEAADQTKRELPQHRHSFPSDQSSDKDGVKESTGSSASSMQQSAAQGVVHHYHHHHYQYSSAHGSDYDLPYYHHPQTLPFGFDSRLRHSNSPPLPPPPPQTITTGSKAPFPTTHSSDHSIDRFRYSQQSPPLAHPDNFTSRDTFRVANHDQRHGTEGLSGAVASGIQPSPGMTMHRPGSPGMDAGRPPWRMPIQTLYKGAPESHTEHRYRPRAEPELCNTYINRLPSFGEAFAGFDRQRMDRSDRIQIMPEIRGNLPPQQNPLDRV